MVSQLRTDKDKKIIKVFRLQHFHQNESVGDERRVSQNVFYPLIWTPLEMIKW